MKILNLFVLLLLGGTTLLSGTATAGVIEIKEFNADCRTSSSDKRCLENASAKTIRGEVVSATLLNEIIYPTQSGEQRRLAPVLRVVYKTATNVTGIILFAYENSSKMGISLSSIQDKMTENKTLISVRQSEESGREGFILAIEKLASK